MHDQRTLDDLFRQQWVHWQPRIYAYIRAVVFHRSDAEDVLQEVAEVLWRKIADFDPATQFEHWAFGVARNKVLNFQKKKARERLSFSDSLTETLADEAKASTQENNLLDSLESCLEKLPAEHRDLLRRRYEPQATSRSVAQVLGSSESAVSRTLNKVYALLLACLDGRPAQEPLPRSCP